VSSSADKRERSPSQPVGRWIRPAKRLALYLRDDFSCAYCGQSLRGAAPADVTLDHLLPRSAGGTNDATNLITACRSCNSSRQDKPWVDFAPGGARDRIEQLRHRPLNLTLAKALIADQAGDDVLESAR
jgi:5-methylcytosine-specific restriction endonuclease McrA